MNKFWKAFFGILVAFSLIVAPIVEVYAAVMVNGYRYGTPAASSLLQSSTQEFTITIGTSATSNTATISSVSTSRSIIVWGGSTTNDTSAAPNTSHARITLTDATTVTAVRNTSDATITVTVSGTVVEWTDAAIASVEYGTVSVSSGSATGTATITSITATNGAVQFLGTSSDATSVDLGRWACRLNITSATQITATRSTTTTGNLTVSFVVFTFESGILNSNTQENTLSATTAVSDTNTITSVTTGQTWLVYGGQNGAYSASSNGQYHINTVLTNGTTITSTCKTAHTWAVTVTVVEFKSTDVQSIQRSEVIVSDASNAFEDETVSAVTTTKSFVAHLGEYLDAGSSASPRLVRTYINLTSTTNKRFSRVTASATVTPKVSSELIELK